MNLSRASTVLAAACLTAATLLAGPRLSAQAPPAAGLEAAVKEALQQVLHRAREP